jgi:hypothetical protein
MGTIEDSLGRKKKPAVTNEACPGISIGEDFECKSGQGMA